MSFFKNNLTSKKYFEILKNNFSKRFILENFGMLLGNKSFYRFLKLSEILLKTKNVKGDIIEFGIWNGNNLFTIKKISDYYDLKKKYMVLIILVVFQILQNLKKKRQVNT